jgi:hypothetical protein
MPMTHDPILVFAANCPATSHVLCRHRSKRCTRPTSKCTTLSVSDCCVHGRDSASSSATYATVVQGMHKNKHAHVYTHPTSKCTTLSVPYCCVDSRDPASCSVTYATVVQRQAGAGKQQQKALHVYTRPTSKCTTLSVPYCCMHTPKFLQTAPGRHSKQNGVHRPPPSAPR